jgi:hypothetical protein
MDLVAALRGAQDVILEEASAGLKRAELTHYDSAGREESRVRLDRLFGLVLEGLTDHTLEPIRAYADTIARERFSAGFDIAEVQTAFNVLEEAIWHCVIARAPKEDLVDATGLIGTVLGAGKDALACTWVSLATHRHVPSLDLSALFEGVTN